jgi:hypothetical protein
MGKKANGIIEDNFSWTLKDATQSPAFCECSHLARCLFYELHEHLNSDTRNNGHIFLSNRNATRRLVASPRRVAHAFRELVHYGFIVQTKGASLGTEGKAKSAHYRLTDAPSWNGDKKIPSTRDYRKWDGTLLDKPPRLNSERYRGSGKTKSRAPRGLHPVHHVGNGPVHHVGNGKPDFAANGPCTTGCTYLEKSSTSSLSFLPLSSTRAEPEPVNAPPNGQIIKRDGRFEAAGRVFMSR